MKELRRKQEEEKRYNEIMRIHNENDRQREFA